MPLCPGSRLILRNQNRLYRHLSHIVTVTSALGLAIHYVRPHFDRIKSGDYMTLSSRMFELEVRLPLYDPMEAAAANVVAEGIYLEIGRQSEQPSYELAIGVLSDTLNRLIASSFATFFEEHKDWLDVHHGSDGAKWPATLDFARVVRNSAAHNLKLTFRTQTSRKVMWQNISYTPADHGRQAIGPDLAAADVIFLMMDSSEELDRLGCPIIE